MRVSLFQLDGKMPNLALMKIASFYRQMGGEVVRDEYENIDRAFISVVFPKGRKKLPKVLKKLRGTPRLIGGTGVSCSVSLPDTVEHLMPDYDLWNVDFSMGFTSRGCIRNCEFCYVPRKEGRIRANASLDEFVHPEHKKVILLDNNLLAAPNWWGVLEELIERRIKVNFSQGLDIRLIDEEKAQLLSETKFYNWKFNGRAMHFAFDRPSYEKQVRKGLEILLDAGIRPGYLMFYVLCDFDTTFEEDTRRYKILWEEYGVYPYIQIFNRDDRKRDKRMSHFGRWVNRRIHKVCDFEDYEPWVRDREEYYETHPSEKRTY